MCQPQLGHISDDFWESLKIIFCSSSYGIICPQCCLQSCCLPADFEAGGFCSHSAIQCFNLWKCLELGLFISLRQWVPQWRLLIKIRTEELRDRLYICCLVFRGNLSSGELNSKTCFQWVTSILKTASANILLSVLPCWLKLCLCLVSDGAAFSLEPEFELYSWRGRGLKPGLLLHHRFETKQSACLSLIQAMTSYLFKLGGKRSHFGGLQSIQTSSFRSHRESRVLQWPTVSDIE